MYGTEWYPLPVPHLPAGPKPLPQLHVIIIRAKRVSNSHQGYTPKKKSVRVWVCVFD